MPVGSLCVPIIRWRYGGGKTTYLREWTIQTATRVKPKSGPFRRQYAMSDGSSEPNQPRLQARSKRLPPPPRYLWRNWARRACSTSGQPWAWAYLPSIRKADVDKFLDGFGDTIAERKLFQIGEAIGLRFDVEIKGASK